jgi:hypothetical protein
MFKGMIVIYVAVLTVAAAKDAKAFSLFNVVTFQNDACTSTSITTNSGARSGQCFTAEECTAKGGTASGGCAMGFGTCCLFTQTTCGGTVENNCTHVQNDGFPTALTGTAQAALPNCNYQINKAQADVCSLRLDFLTFNTQAGDFAAATGGAAAGTMDSLGACRDTFSVVTNTNGGDTPVVCGQNDGEHMYIDIGPSETATATIGFTFMALAATRSWEIKVTQLECGNPMSPPDGCLQYHTGSAGQLTTFNFAGNALHLADQNYNICIRQEMGMTCTVYTVCAAIAGQGLPYSLSNLDAAGAAATAKGASDFQCTEDFIEIAGSSEVCGASVLTNKYCGDVLTTETATAATLNNPICDCTLPFRVGIHTDGVMDATPAANEDADAGFLQSRGVCLDYKQI